MHQRLLALGLVFTAAALGDSMSACAQVPPPATAGPGPVAESAWVIFGSDTVVAELAATGDQRSRGLSHRDDVPDGTGMLFVFESTEERTFWMRDTYVDLDIAFLNENYEVLGIIRMKAETMDLHDSGVPVFMALEVPGGWFDAHDVEVGSTAQIVFRPSGNR